MFACPACRTALARSESRWSCARCEKSFPDVDGIPCLMPDPERAHASWVSEAGSFAEMMGGAEELFAHELQRPDLPSSTRQRLLALVGGNRRHCEVVLDLLARAGITPSSLPGAGAGLPQLVRDYDFALRDWAWAPEPNGENAAALRALLEAWPEAPPRSVLVLGAGAARLAWELHCSAQPELTVALDRSPLNLLVAQKALSGAPLVLHEFPFAPAAGQAPVVAHDLSRDPTALPGFQLLLGDALSPPFLAGSFDLVVTPWFIDVVDAELVRLTGVIHQLLSGRGAWLNHGPLLYPSHRSVAERRPIAEVLELVSLSGFEVSRQSQSDVEHLRSPHDTRRRTERVYTFRADKAPFRESDDALSPPAWQLVPHRPVPREAVGHVGGGHPLLAAAAALVDGQRSTDQIASRLAEHPAFPRDVPASSVTQALLWHLAGLLGPS